VNWQAEAHWQWWETMMDVIRTEQRAIEAARQRAERAEDKVQDLSAELECLQRVYRAKRAGIRLPWMSSYPVP
jgi:predicted secreted Zn-dependent protease